MSLQTYSNTTYLNARKLLVPPVTPGKEGIGTVFLICKSAATDELELDGADLPFRFFLPVVPVFEAFGELPFSARGWDSLPGIE